MSRNNDSAELGKVSMLSLCIGVVIGFALMLITQQYWHKSHESTERLEYLESVIMHPEQVYNRQLLNANTTLKQLQDLYFFTDPETGKTYVSPPARYLLNNQLGIICDFDKKPSLNYSEATKQEMDRFCSQACQAPIK